jgi:putative protease
VASFSNGDGLCFLNAKRELEGFRVNRVEGNHLFLPKLPASLRPGMSLFRNNSQDFDRLLSRPSAERKIPVDMEITATADGFRLRMDQAVADIQIEHAVAKTSQRENIIRQLTKLGGTPYQCANFRMADGFDYFIPGSMLSELRRRVVESRLQQDRSCKPQKTCLALPNQSAPPPYNPTYQYNIANRVSREFYSQHGLESVQPAFELKAPAEGKLLMQCRHCIKYALGFCVKRNGRRLPYREPLCLRLGDGRLFRLEFNCQHCQMNVYAEES